MNLPVAGTVIRPAGLARDGGVARLTDELHDRQDQCACGRAG